MGAPVGSDVGKDVVGENIDNSDDKLDRIELSLQRLTEMIEALSKEVNKLKTQTASRSRRKTNE